MSSQGESRSSFQGSMVGGMYEPESIRLQREVDEFTQRLEHEKSHLLIIEEQIKQVKSELEERNQNVKALRPNELQEKKTKIQIQSSQQTINNERLRLNMTKSKNEEFRKLINLLRKELTSSNNECARYSKQIKKNRKKAEDENRDYQAVSKIAEETNNQIIALQAKHEEEKKNFEVQIHQLQVKLKDKDDILEIEEQKTEKAKEGEEAGGDTAFSNSIVILKRRLNKIIETNKEKRKLMDQYLRNVKVIEDAFDQIKQATGISNIDEIVTTFIKAEEQNYSLCNYVNMLNTEFDQLEESNKEIKEQIQKIVERGQLSNIEKENLERSLKDECEMLQEEIERNIQEAENTKKMFGKIQSSVATMVSMFKQSKFFLCVAQKMNYEDGIGFTENNIVSYLAELEEYISSLITYNAFKREDPNAAISSIPLDQLQEKQFVKKKDQFDAPIDYTINNQDGLQTPQEDIILGKDLYQKFMKMVDTGSIQFQYAQNRNQAANFNKEDDETSN